MNRAWGSICDTGFGEAEANVVCTQLASEMGFGWNGSEAVREAFFGEGSGPIFLERLACEGTESELIGDFGCSDPSPLGVHSCEHDQDAGVKCIGKN